MKRIGKTFCILFFCLKVMVFSEELSFTSRVNTQRLSLGSYLSYEVVISGADIGGLPKLVLPDLQGKFDIMSSSKQTSYSFVNGNVTHSEIRKFSLLPVKTGPIIIGPASIKFKGKFYKTNPIKVTVIPPSSTATGSQVVTQAQSQSSSLASQHSKAQQYANIFASAYVDKNEVFVGEQITFSLKLFRRLRLFSDIAFEVPNFNGFWVEPIYIDKAETLDNSMGRRFHVRELEKKALFPLKPGKITIPESRIGVVVNMFEGQKVLNSKSLDIIVKPLPEEGKPDDFSGLVGEFQLHGVLSSRDVTQNNSITYKITLSGKGNLRSIDNILYSTPDIFKVYKAKVEDKLENTTVVSGERLFHYIIIPKESGDFSFPEFKLSYFSPSDQQYKIITLPSLPIRVYPADSESQIKSESYLPSAQKVSVLNEDLKYLKTPIDLDHSYSSLKKNGIFMVLFYSNLLFMVALLIAIVKRFFWKTDLKVLKSRRAYNVAVSSMGKLSKKNMRNYLSQVQTVILDFLSAKVGEPLLGKTHSEIKCLLFDRNVPDHVVDRVISVLDRLSFLAYTPDVESTSQLSQIELDIKTLFIELKESL